MQLGSPSLPLSPAANGPAHGVSWSCNTPPSTRAAPWKSASVPTPSSLDRSCVKIGFRFHAVAHRAVSLSRRSEAIVGIIGGELKTPSRPIAQPVPSPPAEGIICPSTLPPQGEPRDREGKRASLALSAPYVLTSFDAARARRRPAADRLRQSAPIAGIWRDFPLTPPFRPGRSALAIGMEVRQCRGLPPTSSASPS